MPKMPERRHVARLFVPRHLGGAELECREVSLLDLSARGARIEHREPLTAGYGCVVDLPRALGRLRLPGRVVWTRLHQAERTPEGPRHLYYHSGLAFTGLTPVQQGALAAALEGLRAGREAPETESAR